MTNASRTNWLGILAARGLDVEALRAGNPRAEADLERHVTALAEAAAEQAARRDAWAGTQAAQLAALAASAKEAA